MHVIRRRGWEIPGSPCHARAPVPQPPRLSCREPASPRLLCRCRRIRRSPSAPAISPDPTKDLYPVKRNDKFALDRPITDEKINTSYNNFYEFGMSKNVAKPAQALKLRPWTVKIDGMVEKAQEVGIDDLIRKMPLEERLYRHRCVEAWSMAIPWSGFPFAKLVELAKPLSSAKYVRMETFLDPAVAPGQKQTWYPWPYVEGLTIAEATNDLAFLVTGAYGKPVSKVQGAPLRLAVPWKYGFKSIKSIVRFNFTDQRPKSYWEGLQAAEYGFWANVNPQVAHPRWSQATEELIGSTSAGRRCFSTAMASMSPTSTRVWRRSGSGYDRWRAHPLRGAARISGLIQ